MQDMHIINEHTHRLSLFSPLYRTIQYKTKTICSFLWTKCIKCHHGLEWSDFWEGSLEIPASSSPVLYRVAVLENGCENEENYWAKVHRNSPPALQISWHSVEPSSARVLINIDRGMVSRGLVTNYIILSSKTRLFDLLVLVTDSKRVPRKNTSAIGTKKICVIFLYTWMYIQVLVI